MSERKIGGRRVLKMPEEKRVIRRNNAVFPRAGLMLRCNASDPTCVPTALMPRDTMLSDEVAPWRVKRLRAMRL